MFSIFTLFGLLLSLKYSFILSYIPLYNFVFRKLDEPLFYYLGRFIIVFLWDPPLLMWAIIAQAFGITYLSDGKGNFLTNIDK